MTLEQDNAAFNEWAFGIPEFYFYRHASNLMALELWNKRHGDLLMLDADGDIREDLTKIWKLWEEHGKKDD